MRLKPAKLGLYHPIQTYETRWKNGENCFELFAEETLSHAGLTLELVEPEQVANTDVHVLVIPHASTVQTDDVEGLLQFVKAGGVVIQFGGSGRIGQRTGLQPIRQLAVGYAALAEVDEPLRFFSAESLTKAPVGEEGVSLEWSGAGELRPTPDGPSLRQVWYETTLGEGHLTICAVDVFTTMVLLQQGDRPVEEDGMPAPDGTAPLNDGILKAEETLQQDWEWDRSSTPAGSKFFATPYSDLWRETVVGRIVKAALQSGRTLPVLGYWPSGIKAVAHLSHDSDRNIDESAITTMDVLKPFGVRSTWCMIEPGYSQSVYERVKADGHELAFHYNAVDEPWDETEFKRQFAWLTEAIGTDEVTSNKNHYTRFEGWGELFAWCEACGIQLDQTRGPSKGGNRGFTFATCHPYRPIAWHDEQNRFYDVLVNGFFSQDLDLSDHWGKKDIIYPLLDQVERVEGVAHFLFHQVHIHNSEDVRNALKTLLAETLERGMPWWTSAEINAWERARRAVQLTLSESPDDDIVVDVHSGEALKKAVVYIPLGKVAEAKGLLDSENNDSIVDRWGVSCLQIVTDIDPGEAKLAVAHVIQSGGGH